MKFDTHFFESQEGLQDLLQETLPQNLCQQSGNCCRLVVNFYDHTKLQALAEDNIPGAKEFLDIFIPYTSFEEVRQVNFRHVDHVLAAVKEDPRIQESDITFYHCKYISDDNLCTIYDKRPFFCAKAPHTGWSLMPAGCGFTGWQFEFREKQKKLIRGLKEYLYVMEMLSEDGIQHPSRDDITILQLKELVQEKIKPWIRFGAKDW